MPCHCIGDTHAKGLKREVEKRQEGRLHHTKWKANTMHISILRCTILLGKPKTKELSDTTVQSILHLSKCLSSSIEMHHSEREKGNFSNITQERQLTLSSSSSQLLHLKATELQAKDCPERPDNRKVSFIVKDSYTLKMMLKRG